MKGVIKAIYWLVVSAALIGFFVWILDTVSCRPAVQHTEAVQTATIKVEHATKTAIQAETKAIESRPAVAKAQETVAKATETRVNAGILIEQLPTPIQVEINSMQDLIQVYEIQLEREISRADAWKNLAETQQELIAALELEHTTALKKTYWQALRKGAVGGALAAILVMVLV